MAVGFEGIDFVDERERLLFARAYLGDEVRSFLGSEVGRYLHGRAKRQLEQAKEDSLSVDTERWWGIPGRRKLRKIQQQANLAKMFMSYMADAIIDGNHATTELDEYRK